MLPAYAGMIQRETDYLPLIMNVLPAYAGMILQPVQVRVGRPGAPRVCGDDPAADGLGGRLSLVLPAYAGMILCRP